MKKLTQKLLLSAFLCFCAAMSFAQQKTITGTIKDNNGVPVANASVIVKGTNNGTASDANGNFSIEANGSNPVLEISSVNFKTQEVAVGKQNHIEISLEKGSAALQEVVVTALGIERSKKSLGYS